MPTVIPCARCGKPKTWRRGAGRPIGQSTCRSCQVAERKERDHDVHLLRLARPARLVSLARQCDMSSYRPTEYRTCTCGSTFEVTKHNQKYCPPCRTRGRGGSLRPTGERGYGAEHQRLRADWKRRLAEGEHVECHAAVCFMPSRVIDPLEPWDLGHTADRSDWTGPEHRRCNRKEPQLREAVSVDRVVQTPRRWVL